jgi:uncharacterized protein (TIGR01244 family)
MTFLPRVLSSALLCIAGAGCLFGGRNKEGEAYPEMKVSDFGAMQNVASCGRVWIGSTPNQADLDLATRRGVRTVIDATTPFEAPGYDLPGACAALGLEYVCLDVGKDGVGEQNIDAMLGTLAKTDVMPALIFCGSGTRASMMFAIYRVLRQGVPLKTALQDARRAGMKPTAEDFVSTQVEMRMHRL